MVKFAHVLKQQEGELVRHQFVFYKLMKRIITNFKKERPEVSFKRFSWLVLYLFVFTHFHRGGNRNYRFSAVDV